MKKLKSKKQSCNEGSMKPDNQLIRDQMMSRKSSWMDGWMDEEGWDSRWAPWEIGLSMVPGFGVAEPPVQFQKMDRST